MRSGMCRMTARWFGLLVAVCLVAVALAAGGCIEDAEDTEFAFTNPGDTTPPDTGDDTTTETGGIQITFVDFVSETVIISNQGTLDEDFTNWSLEKDVLPVEAYTFGTFILGAGDTVRVHSKAGTDTAVDLYWDGGANWGVGDTAILKDENGTAIDSCSDGDPCWAN
jgi:competence protein ComEC